MISEGKAAKLLSMNDELSVLDQIRVPLLEEAKNSPLLLSDLAGLEQYIAESYDARSFIELLQNADDAGATRFLLAKHGNVLLVANDGNQFSEADLHSLCRSAASSKSRVSSIGYRGIGFKSVVGLAKEIYLVSGKYRVTFSKERTLRELPEAQRVPLIRIPHIMTPEESASFSQAVEDLERQHYTTIFVFGGLIGNAIEIEFSSFDGSSMLFLRHVQQIAIRTDTVETLMTARRERGELGDVVYLSTSNGSARWRIIVRGRVSLAFSLDQSGTISPLEEQDSTVHAFLPTNEATGFPFKCNGNFSTDPSRTRIVLDERTRNSIDELAQLIMEHLYQALMRPASDMLPAFVPFIDPRMLKFQKRSFKGDLFQALREHAEVVPYHRTNLLIT